jgi:hypothetical protein
MRTVRQRGTTLLTQRSGEAGVCGPVCGPATPMMRFLVWRRRRAERSEPGAPPGIVLHEEDTEVFSDEGLYNYGH